MKDYQAYLFDWDGTLAQTLNVWLTAIQQACKARNIQASDKEIAKGFGNWEHYVTIGVNDLDGLKQDVKAAVSITIPDVPMYQGVLQILKQLHVAGRRMALISSSPREVLDANRAFRAISSYFEMIISADEVTAHKPDPQSLNIVLDQMGVSKENVVMLGDSDKDLGAAVNADIDSILFYPDSHAIFYDRDYLMSFNPARVIASWNELAD